MKEKIHPVYGEATIVCGCGETFKTRSTKAHIAVEMCSKCHPFYTGKQRFVDSAGMVERFQKRYGFLSSGAAPASAEARVGSPSFREGGGAGRPSDVREGAARQETPAPAESQKGTVPPELAREESPAPPAADTPEAPPSSFSR